MTHTKARVLAVCTLAALVGATTATAASADPPQPIVTVTFWNPVDGCTYTVYGPVVTVPPGVVGRPGMNETVTCP